MTGPRGPGCSPTTSRSSAEHSARRAGLGAAALGSSLFVLALVAAAQDPGPAWVRIEYGAIVDGRRLTHSGESVGSILGALGGRPAPPPGARGADAQAHANLDPLLEPYAFVLVDALDSLGVVGERPMLEVGALFVPGASQPAWAEILRARRLLVESDGEGHLRLCLPLPLGAGTDPTSENAEVSARKAFDAAWPVLRHVFAAERRRLGRRDGNRPEDHPLDVEVHAYVHEQSRSLFHLGAAALRVRVTDTRPRGEIPPLDLDALVGFLDRGLRLEGGRLDADGSLRLLGSETKATPALLGRALALADFAVAYRAVAHGGLAEPYMSLDRGSSPQTSIVNYGGRLSDTGLGLVSLLCDVRFKTFSQGIDIVKDQDVRAALRREIPSFATHLERMAADARSQTVQGQQTRLWFYPDAVDLTLSEQGDVLVVRRSRMTASSERVEEGSSAQAAPWTQETVAAINRDYEKLARVFPELADLDRVASLLSLFTWLERERSRGVPVPDLDALLALDLPPLPTPRRFPQLLAYNALPPPGAGGAVEVFSRISVGEALDRLQPSWGALPAKQRFERALAGLDRRSSDHAALARELEALDPAGMDESALDLAAYRAERLRLHQLVLQALPSSAREKLAQREGSGDKLRVFSVGIGGLDLGMRKSLERASRRGESGSETDARSEPATPGKPKEPREEWRHDPARLPETVLPPHGGAGDFGLHRAEILASREKNGFVLTVMAKDGPDPWSRRVVFDAARRVEFFERVERERFLRYRFERQGTTLRTRTVDQGLPAPARPVASATPPPEALAVLEMGDATDASGTVLLRLRGVGATELAAPIPRSILARLILGRGVDLSPGQPLPGLGSPQQLLGGVRHLMVLIRPEQREAPWVAPARPLPGEENPLRIAAALGAWWAGEGNPPAVLIGTDSSASPGRWRTAPQPGSDSVLLLPPEAFPAPAAWLRDEIAAAWKGRSASEVPASAPNLVVLASAEAPGALGGRLRSLARSPALRGKLLAVYSLAGPLREDLPASLLAEGGLAGFGLAEAPPAGAGRVAVGVGSLSAALADAQGQSRRVEELPGPFLWFF